MQSDFEPYLTAIARLYSQQNALYIPTDALLPLEARFVEQQDTQQQQERQVEQFPVLTGLRKYALGEKRHVLLAGRPGSGKSTALKQLAIALAEEGQVPVLVQLKGDRTVPELIQAEFRRAKQRVTLEQIEDWLLADRLILLLDGVNEIPNDDLRRGLAQFREDNSTVPMIFTTRELSIGGDLGIDKRLEMKPLSEPQMREFVKKYLPEHGEQLLTQLRDRLREIAETPLFLKMLCDVFKQTREIPQNKGELFQQFDRNYERLKKDYVRVSDNFWEFKSEILQHLAFSMIQADVQKPTELWLTISKKRAESILENWLHQRGVVDAPTKAKEWLKDLCNHHLLQDAAKPGEIEFHHQLFQEYYAAEHLLQQLPTLLEDENKFKRDYLNYLKWTEAIALVLALVDKEIQSLRIVRLALDIDLMLGARLAGEVKLEFQNQAVDQIDSLPVYEVLKMKLLGNTRSNSAIASLLKALESPNHYVRRFAAEALGRIDSEHTITMLCKRALNDGNFHVRRSASEALGRINSEQAVTKLLDILSDLNNFYIRHNAIEVLGWIGSEQAEAALRDLLNSSDYSIRRNASQAISRTYEKRRKDNLPAWAKRMGLESTAEYLALWYSPMQEVLFVTDREASELQVGNSESSLPQLQQTLKKGKFGLLDSIATIQNLCKYYNHEIAHGLIPQGQPIAVFFSYASKDEALQNELAKHLNLLERQGIITSWNSRQILPGDEREQVINQQLNTANIILLLISSDSIADNTCYDLEITRAMERHQAGEAHVIPILLRPVDWASAPFSQLDVLPKNREPVTTWDNRDEAFREIAEGIRAVAIELRRVMGERSKR
jgi:energy-coupling factor transporter ATP-binding protein EcfA2